MNILSVSGNLEKISSEIFAEAETEITSIKNIAESRIKEITDVVTKDREKLKTQITEKAMMDIDLSSKRALGKARMEGKLELLNVRENFVTMVLDAVMNKSKDFTKSDVYRALLTNLAISATLALEGGNIEVLLRKEDLNKFNLAETTKKAQEKLNKPVTFTISQDPIHTRIGGIVLRKENISVDNTLESLFDRRRDALREIADKVLFEK